MAEIIKGTDLLNNDKIKRKLKEHIEKNCLIGIPTETVYGLGGNSLSDISLRHIFEMKNRPISDPIISHVYDITQAFDQLYNINIFEKYIIYILSKKFWPGPLSVIAKANKNLPLILTAHTSFCAVRIPKNPIALEIIKVCQVPIAAPSANKFQHISPTNSMHVFEEFKNENILIFDDGQCDIGIESTVLKLIKYKKKSIRKVNKKDRHLSCGSKANRSPNRNEEVEEVDGEEEITTDIEYEKECKREMEFFRKATNSSTSEPNIRIYEKLKNQFGSIEQMLEKGLPIGLGMEETGWEDAEPTILGKILKYKNLYDYRIRIYRRGKYTMSDIQDALSCFSLLKDIDVDLCEKIKFEHVAFQGNGGLNENDNPDESTKGSAEADVRAKTNEKECSQGEVSPGMLLTHYSPVVSTYLIDVLQYGESKNNTTNKNKGAKINLMNCILLDIGNSFDNYQNGFLKYINISYDGLCKNDEQINFVMKNFFLFLRHAEELAIKHEAENILISIVNLKSLDENSLSVFDRIFRAASGKIVKVVLHPNGELRRV
ncbi:threonylcarbamoyl-AMP synthase [Plasmodium gonderi]|uniref:Threonylcarbamoyl-AMP synthase n=1 Tax=Plasmodium gonderi TaxID=77519 RepID=A0A1Y1JKE7_PLAGO|nr:threonylcarbamoyl-AMP synthase [Plasmodium gonderi]GAW82770.1 threonylcarbamoyl-AMP synthase [Plasmodium gonderi]